MNTKNAKPSTPVHAHCYPPVVAWFTMVRKPNGEWHRVGKQYFDREVAKSWLPFVRGAWLGCKVRLSRLTIHRDTGGNITERCRRVLDEKFNMDCDG